MLGHASLTTTQRCLEPSSEAKRDLVSWWDLRWRNPLSDLTGISRCQSLVVMKLVPQGQFHSVIKGDLRVSLFISRQRKNSGGRPYCLKRKNCRAIAFSSSISKCLSRFATMIASRSRALLRSFDACGSRTHAMQRRKLPGTIRHEGFAALSSEPPDYPQRGLESSLI